MSAAPAYSYQYPERVGQSQAQPRVSVVPGRRPGSDAQTIPSSVVTLAKIVAVVLVVLAAVSFVRIGLSSAAVSTSLQSQELSTQIESARSTGNDLEVMQSSLSNPSRIKAEAGNRLDMAAPAAVETITLETDVVATDASGDLSLSQSVANAAASKE